MQGEKKYDLIKSGVREGSITGSVVFNAQITGLESSTVLHNLRPYFRT